MTHAQLQALRRTVGRGNSPTVRVGQPEPGELGWFGGDAWDWTARQAGNVASFVERKAGDVYDATVGDVISGCNLPGKSSVSYDKIINNAITFLRGRGYNEKTLGKWKACLSCDIDAAMKAVYKDTLGDIDPNHSELGVYFGDTWRCALNKAGYLPTDSWVLGAQGMADAAAYYVYSQCIGNVLFNDIEPSMAAQYALYAAIAVVVAVVTVYTAGTAGPALAAALSTGAATAATTATATTVVGAATGAILKGAAGYAANKILSENKTPGLVRDPKQWPLRQAQRKLANQQLADLYIAKVQELTLAHKQSPAEQAQMLQAQQAALQQTLTQNLLQLQEASDISAENAAWPTSKKVAVGVAATAAVSLVGILLYKLSK